MNCEHSLGNCCVQFSRSLLCNGCVDQIGLGSQVMIWSTGGSVTDSILRYRGIGHVINTLSCDRSFAVSSLRVVCTVVVRVF